jgi:putative peptidoglycan lipid II flippase
LRLRLPLRPTLRFPTGLAPFARRAAMAGAITLTAQQLSTAVSLRLANGGIAGTLVVLTIAQTVYLVPWAVLAVPVATALFPRMSAAWESGAYEQAAEIGTSGLRIVAGLSAIGTAALVAASTPIANVLLDSGNNAHAVFGPAIAAFAAGLLGWSAVAVLSRILYAARRPQLAAVGQAVGWVVAIIVNIAVALESDRHHRAVVLALGNALGVTVAAMILLVMAVRVGALGRPRLILRSTATAIGAAAAGSLAGWAVSRSVTSTAVLSSVASGVCAALVAAVVAGAIVAVADHDELILLRERRRHA